MPIEMRFIPAARYCSAFASVRDSGLHSIVISAPFAIEKQLRASESSRTISSAGSREGVPPPIKTVSNSRPFISGAYSLISVISAAEYAR